MILPCIAGFVSTICPHSAPSSSKLFATGVVIPLCSAKSRCDLTQQFLRANIHGAARREHLALVSGNWLATHAHGCLGAAAACCRNPECLAPSSHEVVPDCSGKPTPS